MRTNLAAAEALSTFNNYDRWFAKSEACEVSNYGAKAENTVVENAGDE
jgi:hypothetical protein